MEGLILPPMFSKVQSPDIPRKYKVMPYDGSKTLEFDSKEEYIRYRTHTMKTNKTIKDLGISIIAGPASNYA
jgi:hypothetical protein